MFLKSATTLQTLFQPTQVTVAPGSSTTVESSDTSKSQTLEAIEAGQKAGESGLSFDPESPDSIATLADNLLAPLTLFAVFAAIGSLIIIAIRIMFARATGDVDGAKKSSNGIGWIIGALVLVLAAPALIAYFLTQITA